MAEAGVIVAGAVALQPIDPQAAAQGGAPFDGRYQLVSDGARFSVARWDGEAFVYSSGARVKFAPSHFQAPGGSPRDG